MLLNCGVGEDLRVPKTARSSQSILKEINPEYSFEGLMLKLMRQYFGHLMWIADSLEKNFDAGKDWRQEETGLPEDEIVRWHHQLDGHEFEQALEVGDGQGILACCSPWDRKEPTELNWRATDTNYSSISEKSFPFSIHSWELRDSHKVLIR